MCDRSQRDFQCIVPVAMTLSWNMSGFQEHDFVAQNASPSLPKAQLNHMHMKQSKKTFEYCVSLCQQYVEKYMQNILAI